MQTQNSRKENKPTKTSGPFDGTALPDVFWHGGDRWHGLRL
jgi:hypothetical protein